MSDSSRDTTFPWTNLAALLVLITGAISWFLDPISTSRPQQKGAGAAKVSALQEVEARLWQDPLGAASESYTAQKKDSTESNNLEYYRGKLRMVQDAIQSAKGDGDDVLILPVLIPGGSSAERAELRRRARIAVLSGLSVARFVPEDPERIGFFVRQTMLLPKQCRTKWWSGGQTI